MKTLEDLGFYCVDNLPPKLTPQTLSLLKDAQVREVAIALDVRSGGTLGEALPLLSDLFERSVHPLVLFLDARDDVLVRRYSETRRRHPFASVGSLRDAIAVERSTLAPLRALASHVIDTTALTHADLKERILASFAPEHADRRLSVTIVAFGFKYGIPLDLDVLFDVRFLHNPNYVERLRPLTGADPSVAQYIETDPSTAPFLDRLFDMIDFLMPRFMTEGKSQTDHRYRLHGRAAPVRLRSAPSVRAFGAPRASRAVSGFQGFGSMIRLIQRLPPFLRWAVPGLGVKRWLIVAIAGILLLVNGIDRYLVAIGYDVHANELIDSFVDGYFPPSWLKWIFIAVGIAAIFVGSRQWLLAILRAGAMGGNDRILDTLYEMRLGSGYKIVAIGGGTGLSTLLRGLKRKTSNLTAVVTVSDDGGSSGRLQRELGVLPPGDVRNCLVALADDEAMVTDLFRYRFSEGEGLSGHSFGNLFLAAMTGITGNFDHAIKESSRVLNITGCVLPSTLGVARLCARLSDGTVVEGESTISASKQPIKQVFFDPPYAAPLGEVITAIREADAIVLGPGSLYTSILPNFLVDRISREVASSNAVKMYVCNVMTQPGETDRMTAAHHVEALLENAGARVCEFVIVNDQPPSKLREAYAVEGQIPVEPDIDRIVEMGLVPVRAQVISETATVRHDPEKLAQVVMGIIDRSIAQRASYMRPARLYERSNSPA